MQNFFEKLLFTPRVYHYPVILLLMPLSFIYGSLMLIRRLSAKKERYPIPIISIGNLIVGGSGKTPFVVELASKHQHVTIISRGYGRKRRGLIEVSNRGEVLVDVESSGDEAMLMAISLPDASVIVSEDRKEAIDIAIKNGAEFIILDDGFNRVDIQKYEILLEPKSIANYLTFPAGPFREFYFTKRYADLVLVEDVDFVRRVSFSNLTPKMLLVTAISNPQRLDRYLPDGVVDRYHLPDHSYFDEEIIGETMSRCEADSLLVTEKDMVKMIDFKLPISIMKLKLDIYKEINWRDDI